MELNYDWRTFQTVFYPSPRGARTERGDAPVFLVRDEDTIVWAFSEQEELEDWVGGSYEKLSTDFSHRKIVPLDRREVDGWMKNALQLPHFYDQIEALRAAARNELKSLVRQHFLLEAIQGWWSRVLPSTYGIFIRLEGPQAQDFFMVVRRGRVDLFHEPDLSSIGQERQSKPEEVVKYLSQKNLVKVQGLFVPHAEWSAWAEEADPWRRMAMAIRSNRAKLVPFRWSILSLVATRGLIGL